MKSLEPSNLPGILSWKRSLRSSQRLPETSSSVHRSSLPDRDESPVSTGRTSQPSRPRATQVPRRYNSATRPRRPEAINLHSLALGAGITEGNLDLQVQGIPFDRDCDDLAQQLRTTMTEGLAETEAQVRRKDYGENILKDQEKPTILKVLWRQVSNAMTVILVAAMIIAVAIDDDAEGGFIAAIVVANVSIGFFQEYRAERVLDSLRKYSSPTTTVLRTKASVSSLHTIPTSQVVIGDIVFLEAGQVVPADLRLFDSSNLQIDESILTGESITAIKVTETISRDEETYTSIGDCFNCAFSGTVVEKGRGRGIVYAVGMNTEIGKIAETLREEELISSRPTLRHRVIVFSRKLLGLHNTSPLQKTLTRLAHFLFIAAAVLLIILFAISKFRLTSAVALYAISLAVAIIPESLIAVVTTCLAKGVSRLANHKILVLRLDAIETLGAIHDICSDKTGTITMGNMAVRKVSDGLKIWECRGGELTLGELTLECVHGEEQDEGDMLEIIRCAALCNDAVVTLKSDKWHSNGEATEVALQIFAAKSGCLKSALVATSEDLSSLKPGVRYLHSREYRFDPDVRRMTVVYQDLHTQEHIAFMKGAPEWVLSICSFDVDGNEITEETKSKYTDLIEAFASEGLRVLVLAMKELDGEGMDRETVESDMIFLGLIGIRDPPRPESFNAVQSCQRAGIIVHMLTGDHISTATAIATEVGILPATPESTTSVMTAQDFDRMSDDDIDRLPSLPLVVARCSPQTKAQMVKAIHRRGRLAAMTGDGVNDCPSLKIADVGIAMGLAPSDVARQASEIVLADDNFAAVVAAVEEGRRLFDNLIKFMLHLISSNFAEAIVLVVGLAFIDAEGTSVYPLSPVQILWENLVTSIFPAFGLGLEPAAGDVMSRGPRSPSAGPFNKEFALDAIIYGLLMGIPPLLTFVVVVYGFGDGNLGINCNENLSSTCIIVYKARAAVFASLTIIILLHAFEMKDPRKSLFNMNLAANRTLLYSVLGGCLALFPTIYIPKLNEVLFKMIDITWEWALCAASVVIYLAVTEGYKACKRRFWKLDA